MAKVLTVLLTVLFAIIGTRAPAEAEVPPDGKKSASAGESAVSPQRARRFNTSIRVGAVACSPDGKLVAVRNDGPTFVMMGDGRDKVADSWKPTVEILDAATGKSVVTLKLISEENEEEEILARTKREPRFEVGALAFSPDSALLAVGTSIGQVKLFDARTGNMVRSLDDADGKKAADHMAEFMMLPRAIGSVSSLAFSPDGSVLAVGGAPISEVSLAPRTGAEFTELWSRTTGPGRLKLFDVKTGAFKRDLVGYSEVSAVAFSPDGKVLAGAGRWWDDVREGRPGEGVKLWDASSGQLKRKIESNDNGGTRSVAFSPDGKMVAFGGLRFFDKAGSKDGRSGSVGLARVSAEAVDWVQTVPDWAGPVAFSPDGKCVIVLCGEHAVRFLDVEAGKVKKEIRPDEPPNLDRWTGISVATQAHLLAIGGIDGARGGFIEIWDLGGAAAPDLPLP